MPEMRFSAQLQTKLEIRLDKIKPKADLEFLFGGGGRRI